MSHQSTYRPAHSVAKTLGVAPATLRSWSDEFAEYLNPALGKSPRRYTERDVGILSAVKELLEQGMTPDQVRERLDSRLSEPSFVSAEAFQDIEAEFEAASSSVNSSSPSGEGQTALVATNGPEAATISFLTNTLVALSDSQKSILNSHTANRELLGVLIQDNFNLKEENNRLRERVLDLERSTAQYRQEEEWRREALRKELDSKIAAVQQVAAQALTVAHSIEVPDIKAVNTKPGCLGALFGGGGTQIISLPRRRREGQTASEAGSAPAALAEQPPSSPYPPQSPTTFPKPSAPPE
ncbi:MAG: MerR family transcriptional regulator [Anaerolineae bacterium]